MGFYKLVGHFYLPKCISLYIKVAYDGRGSDQSWSFEDIFCLISFLPYIPLQVFLFVYTYIHVGQSNTIDEHSQILITAIYFPEQRYYFNDHMSNIIITISF